MLAARQRQRVDHPLDEERRPAQRRQLGVEEAQVEFGVVDDQPVVADEGEKLVDHRGEHRLVGERSGRMAMDPVGVVGDVALRIDQHMKDRAGGDLIDDLYGADFDQAVALRRVEAGRFGVEHDLTHRASSGREWRPRRATERRPGPGLPDTGRECR